MQGTEGCGHATKVSAEVNQANKEYQMGGHMYRCLAKVLVFALATAAFLPQSALAQTKGNGLPGGQKLLFNLEVIAYDPSHCPSGNANGHRIAVKANVNDLTT